tara:strand:+ start:5457 stop:5579 length:123 start_codon:yes stop_codon:yes gene_type:complete
MKRAYLYIMARFYQVRADAALDRWHTLSAKAAKYFSRLGL